METVRKAAWETLCRCEKEGQYSNLAIDTVLKKAGFSEPDRALFTQLVYGTVERQVTLDAWIDQLAGRDPEPAVRVLLRLGLYQLAFLDRVPDHAAVNETVALAPRRAAGFVNAVLRAFLRRGKRIDPPDAATDPVGNLAVRFSVCRPLAKELIAVFGFDRAAGICAAYGQKPPVCLRVNTVRTTAADLAARLRADGYDPEPLGRDGLLLHGNVPVAGMAAFREGLFFVQDEASQRCVRALDARPGMTVLDVCACPGSKSFGAAIDMTNEGAVLAFDLHPSKLSLVESGAARLGLTILSVAARDARDPLPAWVGKADRVICDVPCSGYGVVAKKPDLRLKDPATSAALPAIQSAILERSATLLAPGGRLVYSTCTILPAENAGVVEPFLRAHPSFVLEEQTTLYPDTDGTDGFYYAVLRREN